jgi:hypothetical protein
MGSNTRDKKPLRAYGIEWVGTPFNFIPNASDSTAAPLAANVVGSGVSVTIQGTGLYRVSLPGGAPNMVVNLQLETALKGLYQIEVGTTSSTAGQVQIRVFNFGTTTLANFAATTSTQKVHGLILQQASSYTR